MICDTIAVKTPIDKGWSCDKKYHVTTIDGVDYLLRVTPREKSGNRADMFEMMKQVASLGVPMCRPVEFGECEDGVYSLQSWIDGQDAEDVIPTLSDTEQYVYGLDAGRILKRLHSIPAPASQEDWEVRFNRKLHRKLKMYAECPIKYENGQAFIGNICFGTEKDGERYFVKFAGAPTEQYNSNPADAVERLKATIPIYEALRHINLIEFVSSEEIGGGFALVFKWADGECMGRMYPASHKKFMAMPTEIKFNVFRDVLSFFEHTASVGYVAVDFYDGCIMYDFVNGKTTICDIDFFRKSPAVNDMGRMLGSSRFMSPEEFELGAAIDEITNVYTLGATAFALFADYNRSHGSWTLSDELYKIASRAISDDRSNRQQMIKQFIGEWEAASCR